MYRRYTAVALGLIILTLTFAEVALAQTRAYETAFIRPRVGLSYYLGDNEESPFNMNGDAFEQDGKFPFSAGGEIGYQFNPRYSLSLSGQYANYPVITQFVAGADTDTHITGRTTLGLIARYLLAEGGRVSPYVQAGAQVTFGKTLIYDSAPTCLTQVNNTACIAEDKVGFGPHLGLGLDFLLSDRASFFLETSANLVFPDEAADGTKDQGFSGFDILGNSLNLGFQFNFRAAPIAPMVLGLSCPASLVAGDEGDFEASVNPDATAPVMAAWSFGDGASASGLSARHGFASAGNYTVSFTASNRVGSATDTCSVRVEPRCEPVEIVTMTASPMRVEAGQSIAFSSNVRGTGPLAYRWNFGEGGTSTAASPSHPFMRPGTFTVTLEVSSTCNGSTASRTLQVTADEVAVACPAELNAVFFARNSSTLSEEGRARLSENLEIMADVPNLTTRIEGFAAPGERRSQGLSADRARAVEQYYIDNGIAASRLTAVGLGRVEGVTSKKEGTAQYRRVDSIPICVN